MKKNFLGLIVLFCCFFQVQANNTKDTINIANPTYFSEYERMSFENFLKFKKADILALSLCVDSTANQKNENVYREAITTYLHTNQRIFDKIANEKSKINKVFKTAQQTFFTQYDSNAIASNFYTDGKYNCVTGSVFFSIIMDSLKIPYTIKEIPTHVFLLAYPTTFSLPIESTDPNMKILIPDEAFKKRYVDFLVDSKLIQKSDIATKGVETIFNEKYYSTVDIKPVELVGLQYFNSGISYLSDNNYKSAFQQFEKAYLLYPSERIRYVLELSLLAFMGNMGPFTIDNLNFVAKLANYSKNQLYHDIVTDQFKSYTQKFLINANDETKYEEIYDRLISQIEDSTVSADISTVYYYERSRVCSIKNNAVGSWKFICQGYKINSKNIDVISRLHSNVIQKLKAVPYDKTFINLYDSLMNAFPSLRNNQEIVSYEGEYYLNKAHVLFDQDNIVAGEKLLKKFEVFIAQNPNCKYNPNFIADFFCDAASAYYRKKDMKKCKLIIERGLELAPNHERLIRKYKMNITHEID